MNNTIFYFLYGFAHQSAWIDNLIIFFAVWFPYVVIALAMILLFFYHKKTPKEVLVVFYSGIIAWALSFIFKIFFHSLRPFEALQGVRALFSEADYSFPSGHATFFFALAFSLFFNHKQMGYLFIIFAILISVTRMMAGVHFPIDILGGLILGFIISSTVNFLNKKQ